MAKVHTNKEVEFYVVALEQGAENPSIPTWANVSSNPLGLSEKCAGKIECVSIENVQGAFQLLNVVSPDECQKIISLTERLGYMEDAAVSLPRSVRHNHSVTWVVDEQTSEIIWSRCRDYMNNQADIFFGKKALGLNNRFRFYRYCKGDYFKPHTDGSWPGSKIIEGKLKQNAFADRWSQLTFLLFLSDDYQGGSTQFFTKASDSSTRQSPRPENIVDIRTPAGGVLCFPHGAHPSHCVHGSMEIVTGTKYIVRSDVLFEL